MNTQHMSQTCKADSYCQFGAETLLKLLAGIDDLIGGVIENTDIEYVHKTRVASRRLRAALPLFRRCYSKKDYWNWIEEIKKITRLLACARDLDVQIAFVKQYIKKEKSSSGKTAIDALLINHINRRKTAQTAVSVGLEELKTSGILKQIEVCCRQIIAEQTSQTFKPSDVLDRAHWNISFKLDDFLSMQKYVYQEKRKIQHHQMRIYAKKLRYTMECFAPLFEDKLEEEITTMKAFQDVLGEMHDCDVWTEYIPQFKRQLSKRKNIKTKNDPSLQYFQLYILERRKKFYSQFVSLWKNKSGQDFFNNLREKTGKEFMKQTLQRSMQALKNPHVKVAVLSDVHANLQALEKILENAEERGATVFLNAGDSVGFGANPNEVVQLLCEKSALSIMGNFDLEILEDTGEAKGDKRFAYEFAKKELSKAAGSYLSMLPRELKLEVAGRKLYTTHGAPGDIEKHIYSDAPVEQLEEALEKAKADVIVVGHSHEQFWRKVDAVDFVNPGSVGRPGDGNPKAAYALLSFNPFKVELLRVDYEVEDAADELRKKGLPESYSQMLLSGVSLDFILKEDLNRWNATVKKEKELTDACNKFAVNCWPDDEHYRQVTGLALALFDSLFDLHKLGKRERCWLRYASILHDVGLSKGGSKHHKKSAQLILNSPELPFSSRERRIIASVARYHRRTLPKQKHYNLSALDKSTINKVCVLSSILRVADSLDYTHQSMVKILGVKIGKMVSIECISNSDLTLEEQAFNKKKDLFEKIFNRKTVLIWNRQRKTQNA